MHPDAGSIPATSITFFSLLVRLRHGHYSSGVNSRLTTRYHVHFTIAPLSNLCGLHTPSIRNLPQNILCKILHLITASPDSLKQGV